MSDDAAAKRRARQTLINLLLSLAATAGLVVAVVLAVPRTNESILQPVDYVAIGQAAADASNRPILLPPINELGDGWWSNSARWRNGSTDGVENWYVGFVGPKNEYVAITQAFESNPTWLAQFLKLTSPTDSLTVNGFEFTVHTADEKNDPPKTKDYVLAGKIGADDILIYGTADQTTMRKFAELVVAQISKVYQ